MDKKEICEKIKYAIRKVAIVSNDSVLSFGSGVVINSSGLLLTANHILDEYLALPNVKIIVEGVGKILPSEYKIRLGGPSIDIDTPEFVKPIIIDLAILEPITPSQTDFFVELNSELALEGTEVIMAGFPDDINPPLNFDKALKFDNPKLGEKKRDIEKFFEISMRFLMMRSAMVGNIQKVKIVDAKRSINIDGGVYWLDNTVTYGASGGAVVDDSCKLIGIISEKGVTDGVNSE
ncbi:MAG: serine protease, partial [Candidatus Paceibacterota bacterium]